MKEKEKLLKRQRRKLRIRSKVYGASLRPRLSVQRSNRHIYAQIIDDEKGRTLVSASDRQLPSKKDNAASQTKTDLSFKLGELLAARAAKKKITHVVFDRAGYKYHGRIKALAEGARKGGLIF